MLNLSSQEITFDGIPNARELGGYRMTDGRAIRHGLLLRGGHLAYASDEDILRLSDEFHVRHVFDFRSETEREFAPDREIPGSKSTWMPTLDMYTDQKIESFPPEAYRDLPKFLLSAAFTDKGKQLAAELYPSMIDNEYTQLQYASFMQQVINTPDGAIYWHCSQGKDRTGIGAAFLLAALGAGTDLIIEDFNLSNEAYKDLLDDVRQKVKELGGGEDELEVIQAFIGVSTRNFLHTLDIIDEKYGGMSSYLNNQLLVSESDMAKLQDRFLE